MLLALAAGDLKDRITLQTRAPGTTSFGDPANAWVDAFSVWAKPEPLQGREFFAGDQMAASVDVRFKVRYRSDITSRMRLVWRGQPYDIASVINTEGRDIELQLMCTSGIRDGRA